MKNAYCLNVFKMQCIFELFLKTVKFNIFLMSGFRCSIPIVTFSGSKKKKQKQKQYLKSQNSQYMPIEGVGTDLDVYLARIANSVHVDFFFHFLHE